MKIRFPVLAIISILSIGNSDAAANYWNSNADGNWFNDANWSLGRAPVRQDDPANDDDVRINPNRPPVVLQGTDENIAEAYARSLQLAAGSSMSIGNATLTITVANDLTRVGTTNGNRAEMVVQAGGTITFSDTSRNNDFLIGFGSADLTTTRGDGYVRVEAGGRLALGSASRLFVGDRGDGELYINGGSVESGTGSIGNRETGSGSVTIDNGGEWNIINGGLFIANNINSKGTLTVNGGNLTTSSYILIGNQTGAQGSMEINSGKVTANNIVAIGNQLTEYKSEITVNGGELSSTNALYIGRGSDGLLTLNGGLVSFTNVFLGNTYNGTGNGELMINGGELSATGGLYIGYATGTGYVKLANNAVVTVNTISIGRQGEGTLEIATDQAAMRNAALNGLSAIAGGASAGTVRFSHAGNLGFSNVMSGANLKVEHTGTGTTTLNVRNLYAGGTVITSGTLISNHQNSLGSGLLEINGGSYGSLVGNVSVGGVSLLSGAVNFNDGAARTLSLTAGTSFLMNGGTLNLDILGVSSYDRITGSGQLSLLNGTLTLYGFAGFEGTGSTGRSYQLFNGFNPAAIGSITITGYDAANWQARLDTTGKLTFVSINAMVNNWSGAADNNWFNDANWRGLRNPGDYNDRIFINNNFAPDRYSIDLVGGNGNPSESTIEYLRMGQGTSLTIANATLNITDTLDNTRIGTTSGERAVLIIQSGGTVSFTDNTDYADMLIGYASADGTIQGKGYVRVEAGGLLLLGTGAPDEKGELKVGDRGEGELHIDGGMVRSAYGRIGNAEGGKGLVTVDNGGSWIMTNDLYLSNRAGSESTLIINDGTVSTGTYVSIGEKYEGPKAEVILNGGELTGGTYLYVGRGANGTLTVNDGLVSFRDVYIGNRHLLSSYGSGTGDAHIKGGELVASNSIVVGYSTKAGTLTVENNAVITTNTITVGRLSEGTLVIATDGATLRNTAGDGLSAIAGGSSAGTVRFSHAGNLGFANVMSGANIKVEHTGSGTTTINGQNSYQGGTFVSNGLVVSNHLNSLGTGILEINGGAYGSLIDNVAIGGVSLITGQIAFNDNTARSLTLTSDFSMTGGRYELDILSLESFDQILGATGQLTLAGGVLALNGYAGFEGTDVTGYSYQLFNGFSPATIGSISITGYDAENWVAHLDQTGRLYFEVRIPEPSASLLFLSALAGLALCRRRVGWGA